MTFKAGDSVTIHAQYCGAKEIRKVERATDDWAWLNDGTRWRNAEGGRQYGDSYSYTPNRIYAERPADTTAIRRQALVTELRQVAWGQLPLDALEAAAIALGLPVANRRASGDTPGTPDTENAPQGSV